MIAEIVSFLQRAEPDFNEGFALFCKYSRSEPLMSWISRRRDMEKLLYELKKLANQDVQASPFASAKMAKYAPSQEPQNPEQSKDAPPSELAFRTYDDRRVSKRSDLPPELKVVYDKIAAMYKLRRGLHEKMKMAIANKDRSVLRSKLIEASSAIKEGWQVIDEYLAAKDAEAHAADKFNESTCRSYISKALSRKKNSPSQVLKVQARVKALQEHGCIIEQKTLDALKAKGLLQS